MEFLRSVRGSVGELKKPGFRKNTHSFFKVFFPVPRCILRSN